MTWTMEGAWYGTLVEPIPGVPEWEQPIDAEMEKSAGASAKCVAQTSSH